MAKNQYATSSHVTIMKYFKENPSRLVRVSDIDAYLKSEGVDVNSSTIYRYLNQLSKEEQIMKYPAAKGEMTSFQYIGDNAHSCKEHLHLHCTSCGRIIHLECDFMKEITEHISDHHGFRLQCEASVLYGICKECAM